MLRHRVRDVLVASQALRAALERADDMTRDLCGRRQVDFLGLHLGVAGDGRSGVRLVGALDRDLRLRLRARDRRPDPLPRERNLRLVELDPAPLFHFRDEGACIMRRRELRW